jgi:hypothetical protein
MLPCEKSTRAFWPSADSEMVSRCHLTSSSTPSDWSRFPQGESPPRSFLLLRKHRCLRREFFPPHIIHRHCPPQLPGIVSRPCCCTRLTTPERIARRPLGREVSLSIIMITCTNPTRALPRLLERLITRRSLVVASSCAVTETKTDQVVVPDDELARFHSTASSCNKLNPEAPEVPDPVLGVFDQSRLIDTGFSILP